MTLRAAQAAVRALGMVLTSHPELGEYRLNFKGGTEATAYYTNDLDDAIATAEDMAQRHLRPNPCSILEHRNPSPCAKCEKAVILTRSGAHGAECPWCGQVFCKRCLSQHERSCDPSSRSSKMEHRNPSHIPGAVVEVRYRRSPGKYFQHTFKPGVHQRNNADGSVTLYHPSRRIWADDREPGFWRKYGDHNPRGGSRMAKTTPWMTYALIGLGLYLIMRQPQGAGTATVLLPGGGSTVTAPDILSGG